MQVCPVCNSEIPNGSKFCHSCGWKVGRVVPKVSYADVPVGTIIVCPKCGAQNFRTDAVCRNCESDLTPAKMAVAGKTSEDSKKGLLTCMTCGTQNPEGYKYCSLCGSPLQTTPEVTQGPIGSQIGSLAKVLFYLVSFFITAAGFVIGAVFYARYPDPRGEFRNVGIMCLMLAVFNIIIGLIVIAGLWLAGFVFLNT